jgi:hypothetical protein
MRYAVINADSIIELEKFVNQYIKNGWKCTGGIAITSTFEYYQAMIKE